MLFILPSYLASYLADHINHLRWVIILNYEQMNEYTYTPDRLGAMGDQATEELEIVQYPLLALSEGG